MDLENKVNKKINYKFHLLTIAGSDSGGGAGIQADIKTATLLGGYAATAITAITAQNTKNVDKIAPLLLDIIMSQIYSVLSDFDIGVIKIGMLTDADLMIALSDVLRDYPNIKIILDPVIASSTGKNFLDDVAIKAMKKHLIPKVSMVTPNIPELNILANRPISSVKTALENANILMDLGANAVLIKGGHSCPSDNVTDILITHDGNHKFSLPFINTKAGHGTGCVLSTAIACYLGMGCSLIDAVQKAKYFTHQALMKAPIIGGGTSPLYLSCP